MRLIHQHQAEGGQALCSIIIPALSRKATPPTPWLSPRAGFTGLLESGAHSTWLPWQAPAVPNLNLDSDGLSTLGSVEHDSLSRGLKLTLTEADRRHSQGREKGLQGKTQL